MKKAKYIVLEGSEGTGKSSQTEMLVNYLRNKGFNVLKTKEPGVDFLPLTMKLRQVMLDKKYDKELTVQARELISQAIRSIHNEHLIKKSLEEVDFIIQDRGILSGLAYGEACGNSVKDLMYLTHFVNDNFNSDFYDLVLYFDADYKKGLERAKAAKKEFEAGDAIEDKGVSFLKNVNSNFKKHLNKFNHEIIGVEILKNEEDGKRKTFNKILKALKDKGLLHD